MDDSDHGCGKNGKNEAIEPVHQSAMSRNNAARVFRAALTFDVRFEEVTELRENRQDESDRAECHGVGKAEPVRDGNAADDAGYRSGDRTAPCLVGADRRTHARAADERPPA